MSATVTTTITELPESRVRVETEVAATELERSIQRAARKLGANLRVPGFRKGKVPPQVVISRLGRDYVLDEAVRDSLGAWYAEAIDSSTLAVIGEPDINVGDMPAEGQPLSFTVEIGVRPEAKLGEYLGVEVPRREANADADAVDAEIERLRERMATLDTVERSAENGDFVVADYVGKLDGEPFDGGTGRDQLIELGSGQLIPGFEEQLVGASADEDRVLTVTFPDDYGAEHLSGKDATFDVHVNEVKSKSLPELDDDFAADAAGMDTLAELREDIEQRLRESQEHEINHEFEREVLDTIAANAEIEVPAALIHARAHEIVSDTINSLASQGIDRQTYLRIIGKTEEELAHEGEAEADRSLRRDAVLAAVIEAEQIKPTDEEVLEVIGESAAERSNTTAEQVFERLQKNGQLERVRQDVAAQQALKRLVEAAKPVPVSESDETDPEAAADKPAKPKATKAKTAAKPKAAKPKAAKPAKSDEEPADDESPDA